MPQVKFKSILTISKVYGRGGRKGVWFFDPEKKILEFDPQKKFFLYIRKWINGKFSILGLQSQKCGFFTNKPKISKICFVSKNSTFLTQ